MLLGGGIFHAIEHPYEVELCKETNTKVNEIIPELVILYNFNYQDCS